MDYSQHPTAPTGGECSTIRCNAAALAVAGLLLLQAPAARADGTPYGSPSNPGGGVSVDAGENVGRSSTGEDTLGVYNETQHVDDADGSGDYWHYTSAVYVKQTESGKIIGQMNRTSKNNGTGLQIQLGAYPELSGKEYLHLGYAYSGSDLFPRHYASGELYTNRMENFGFSAGAARYEYDAVHVNMFTGSLSVYDGYFMYRYRPKHFAPSQGPSGWLHRLIVRRYFDQENKYVSLEGSVGNVPDLEQPDSISSFDLKVKTLFLNYQFPVRDSLYIKLGAGYTEEEFPGGREREKISLLTGLFFTFQP